MENMKNSDTLTYTIFLFPNSHVAIKAELTTKKLFPSSRLIPLPPEVSAGCGMVLRADFEETEAVSECLKNANVEVQNSYKLKIVDGKRIIEKLN